MIPCAAQFAWSLWIVRKLRFLVLVGGMGDFRALLGCGGLAGRHAFRFFIWNTKGKRSMSTRSRKAPVSGPAVHSVSAVLSPRAAYDHFLSDAKKLADGAVLPCRGDLPLALHNVQLGVEQVLPHSDRIKAELPALDLKALGSLPNLAAGLLYAADRVAAPASNAEVSDKLSRLRTLREPMLLIAEGLAEHGLLPVERVRAIRAGKGAIDAARDGIALEALYREHAAALRCPPQQTPVYRSRAKGGRRPGESSGSGDRSRRRHQAQ